MSFLEFGREVLKWVDESEEKNLRAKLCSHEVYENKQMSEIRKLLAQQQTILEKQQKQIDALSSPTQRESQRNSQDNKDKSTFTRFNPMDNKCFNCGGTGHRKAECPSPRTFNQRGRNFSSRGHSQNMCNTQSCEVNHESTNFKRETLSGASQPVDSSVFNAEIFNNITGKCPEVDIEIENQPIRSLIDTGSQVSTISESFSNNLLKQRPILL